MSIFEWLLKTGYTVFIHEREMADIIYLYYKMQIFFHFEKLCEQLTCLIEPDHAAQSITCLATDASLTADLGVASLIPARSHTFVEIDHGHSPPFR